MKSNFSRAGVLVLAFLSLPAAAAPEPAARGEAPPAEPANLPLIRPLAEAPDWRVRRLTNAATRRVRSVTNSYVELATHLNVQEPNNRWRPANPHFKITGRGVEATEGALAVFIAPAINRLGAVTVREGEVTLQSPPLCIAYYDPVSGRSERLAEITNAVGWRVASNEVVFSNCFDGLRASIRYKMTRTGMAQDLILHERPAFSPEDLGFSSEARLELFTRGDW